MAFEKWDPQPEFERFPASATIVQSRLIRLPSPVASMLRLRGKTSANLYYDKKRKVIGIRALEKKEEGARRSPSDKSTSLHVLSFFALTTSMFRGSSASTAGTTRRNGWR